MHACVKKTQKEILVAEKTTWGRNKNSKKIMSLDGVNNYQKILKAVEKNSKTDLTWDDMLDIGKTIYRLLRRFIKSSCKGRANVEWCLLSAFRGQSALTHAKYTQRTTGLPPNNQLSQGDEHTQGYVNYQFYDDSAVFSDGEDASE